MDKIELEKLRESMFEATHERKLSSAGKELFDFVDHLRCHKLWDDYELNVEELEVHAKAIVEILKDNCRLNEQLGLAMASQGVSTTKSTKGRL